MDPFAAIGLAGNIVAFIDFGVKVVKSARGLQNSASGSSTENEDLEFLSTQLQSLTLDITNKKAASEMTADELRLDGLVKECQSLSEELLKLLDSLKVKDPGKKSKRQAMGAVFRNLRKKNEKDELSARLDRCKHLLHLQLSQTTRLETQAKLSTIIKTSTCQESELQQLLQHVETLRDGVKVTSLGPDLLADIRGLMNLADDAINKVHQRAILEALKFDRMNDRYDVVDEAYQNTFRWIYNDVEDKNPNHFRPDPISTEYRRRARESFIEWSSSGQGIFHISGKPGSGKSTLMKYLCEHKRTLELLKDWAKGKELIFAKFFFWRHGTKGQKSLNGLLRSLLYSIVSELTGLIKSTFPAQWEAVQNGGAVLFSHKDIQNAFASLMKRHDVFEKHKFTFFIDGLDEFEGGDESLIRLLFSWVHTWPDEFKICVSSRELPIFQERFSGCPKFRLHELTEPDIKIYVKHALEHNEDVQAMPESNKIEILRLGDNLVEKAEGVFLWVTLAVKNLEQGILLEDTIGDLKKKMDSLPRQLEELFSVIFETINRDLHPLDRQRALRTLALIVACDQRPVFARATQLQVSFIDDYEDNKSFVDNIKAPLSEDGIQHRLRKCRKQIEGRCQGFLSLVNRETSRFGVAQGNIEFTHRSLVEFFQKPEIWSFIQPYSEGNDIVNFKCQAFLAELKCVDLCSSRKEEPENADDSSTTSASDSSLASYGFYQGKSKPHNDVIQFREDMSKIYTMYCHLTSSQYPEASEFLGMIRPLTLFAERYLDPPFRPLVVDEILLYTPFKVRGNIVATHLVKCRASFIGLLKAAMSGLYDLSKSMGRERQMLELHQSEIPGLLLLLTEYQLQELTNSGDSECLPTQVLLSSVLGSLALGVSPDEPAYRADEDNGPRPSLWQMTIWSYITYPLNKHPIPFLLSLLVYGADPRMWLEFDTSCGDSIYEDKEHISVNCRFGPKKIRPFPAWSIRPDDGRNGDILELAGQKGWSLTLSDIIQFWYPASSQKFEKIVELNMSRIEGDIRNAAEVQELITEFELHTTDWPELGREERSTFLTVVNQALSDDD